MTLDEAIKHCEEVAEYKEAVCKTMENEEGEFTDSGNTYYKYCKRRASEHRQLAEWLRELKESRMVLDILGQFLVDTDLDNCCEDLVMADNFCEYHCEDKRPLCWYRWAKMKAREVNADDTNRCED
jgi:hypothetical protein